MPGKFAPMVRARLLAAVFAVAASLPIPGAALARPDCGELPRGKNPTPEELAQAMEELSATFNVPTEIIKGVAMQESGVQQWKSDGSFVHNATDCGLGMMQLTGSTAEQFDVDRLKKDWRYNLEAGVRVLESKWTRAARERWTGKKELPPPDPTIVENWYYALSYYQGKRTGEYPGKVFSHIEKRPGVLRKLIPEAIDLSVPEEAFPGFSYGPAFTALPGNEVVLEGGKRLKVKTTRGTIGDPGLLAKLDQTLQVADKSRASGDLRRAIRYYRAIVEAKKAGAATAKAETALKEISAEARAALDAAEKALAAGDAAGAILAFEGVEERFLGLPESERAGARADEVRADPKRRAELALLESEKEARFLLEKGEKALARGDASEALRLLRKAARFDGAPSAAKAANTVRVIEADPALMAEVRERERAAQVREWLGLAESYLENDLASKAIDVYRKALAAAPAGSPEAERARKGLAEAERRRDAD